MAKFDELEARVTALEEAAKKDSGVAALDSDAPAGKDESLEQRVAELEKTVKTLRK